MKSKNLSAVIFDFDNTLIDSLPVVLKSLENTLRHFHITDLSSKEIEKLTHSSLKDYFPNLFKENLQEATDLYINSYIKFSSNLMPLPGAEAVLRFLKKSAIPTIVISNKRGELLRKEVKEIFKWEEYFTLVLGSGDTDEDKPSASPVLFATSTLGLDLNEKIWFIGDSVTDIICATDSGCLPILFGENSKIDVDLLYTPKFHFKNHTDTLKFIKSELC